MLTSRDISQENPVKENCHVKRNGKEMDTINEWPGMTFKQGRKNEGAGAELDSNASYQKFPQQITTSFLEA